MATSPHSLRPATVVARAWGLDGRGTNGIADTATDFLIFSQITIDQPFAKQGVTPTSAQRNTAVAQHMGLTQEFLAGIQSWDRGTTADVTSRGYEFEAIYNPTRNWRLKFTAAQQVAIDHNGKPRSQVREWRWNAVTNHDFTNVRLTNFSVGGALRWQDQGGIGFLAAAPDSDGVVRELDANEPR